MRRVLVGIAPVRMPGVARPVPIPCRVGVIFWRAVYDPMVTVIVKATRSLRTNEFIAPRALAIGRDLDVSPHDFVPTKEVCDILVSGHVEVPMLPSGEIVPVHAIVRAQGASLAFLVSSSAAARVPLKPPNLTVAGDGISVIGPSAPRIDPASEDFNFLLGFDYDVFNVAHPRLRSERIPPGSEITIDGIGGAPIVVKVPDRPARALIEWTRSAAPSDARLGLDTVHIDLDRELCDFTWRGAVPVSGIDPRKSVDRVLVGFISNEDLAATETDNPETRYAAILSNLSRGTFQYAWEYSDVASDEEPPELPLEEREMARYEALGGGPAPPSTLTLAEHAQISAELLEIIGSRGMATRSIEEEQARADVLSKYELDDFTWTIEERAHADRLAAVPTDVEKGIHAEYGRLFVAAQDRLAPPNEAVPSARDYATICTRLRVEQPRDVLSDAKLSLGAWMRIDRKWQKKIATDEKAREEVQGYLETEAAERGEPRIPQVDDKGRFLA